MFSKVAASNTHKTLYKRIFRLFKISGVYNTPKIPKIFSLQCLWFIFFCSLTFSIYLLHACFLIGMEIKKESILNAANVCLTITSGIHRICLCLNLNRIRKVVKKINSLFEDARNEEETKKMHFFIGTWMTISTLLYVPLVINSILSISNHEVWFFLNKNQATLKFILSILYPLSLVVYFMMPLNAFSIFYALACYHISHCLKNFAKSIHPRSKFDYRLYHTKFLRIRKTVKYADQQLRFFVFLTVIYNASLMYFAVTKFLRPQLYGDAVQQSTIHLLCFSSFVSFFTMMISASRVNELFSEIADRADVIPEDNRRNVITQFRLYRNIDQEFGLTVWNIVYIKRSFILMTLGTCLTYCLLLYNIQAELPQPG